MYFLLPFKFIVQILFFLTITVLFSFLSLLGALIVFALLLAISPLIILALVCQIPDFFLRLLGIVFIPMFTVLLIGLLVIMALLYPIMRNYYHHGVYDGLENYVSFCALLYLKVVKWIFSW